MLYTQINYRISGVPDRLTTGIKNKLKLLLDDLIASLDVN